MILGITGHRPPGMSCGYEIPNPVYEKVYKLLTDSFNDLCPEKIISGLEIVG
jgi:hypothetical protein